MDAVSLASAIRAKQLSPVEVVTAAIRWMDELDPILHAFCTPTQDLALATAKRIEADLMAGKPLGLLAGVPIGIKDLFCTAGIRTTCGSIAYQDFIPDEEPGAHQRGLERRVRRGGRCRDGPVCHRQRRRRLRPNPRLVLRGLRDESLYGAGAPLPGRAGMNGIQACPDGRASSTSDP